MKLQEKGVRDESVIYLYNSSMLCKDYFYQLLCTGHYYCGHNYAVRPNRLDSYLIVYIISGSLYTQTRDRGNEVLQAGQMSILNCYERPSYGCTNEVEFLWLHFDSHEIDRLYNEIKMRTVTVANIESVRRCFNRIIEPFENGGQPSEAIVNKYITILLTEFFESDSPDHPIPKKFEGICNYISNHLDEKVSNDTLAKMANMSTFHFIRSFKKETGFTPHEFLLRSRINAAIFLLRATSLSLSEITYKCGFANEAAFGNSFKAFTGTTPLKCRQEAENMGKTRNRLASMEFLKEGKEE